MSETTQAASPANSPTAYGWCAWHQNHARGVRLIRAIEQGSGTGGNLFACLPCRQAYDLTPYADQP
ncbi:hypothetical protein [Streptomyces sp. NPDC020489]|uniref:hypothetical protein n=1 Tax=Streptomyces sp. NPDC020489 TaxID=3365077 RepID=UPI0037B3BABD